MTTNDATSDRKTTKDDVAATDLLETLEMKKTQRQFGAGGTWVKGTMGGHRFDALVFPEHADHPDYELDGSRISKLWVRRNSDRQAVAYFERGWDLRPTTPVAEQIVDLLAAGLAETIFAS